MLLRFYARFLTSSAHTALLFLRSLARLHAAAAVAEADERIHKAAIGGISTEIQYYVKTPSTLFQPNGT